MLNGMSQSAVVREMSVSLVLELHHRRLDEMLDRVEMAVEVGSWTEARTEFAQFELELEEHMRIEEEMMFPSFEAFARSPGGPTTVMRAEHREIRGVLANLEELLGDEQSIDEATSALETLLSDHNAKEEQVIYPMFERHAPPEAYAALNLELRPLVRELE